MPSKPLRQEQILRRPVDVRDRRVPERMEGVEAIEAGLDLKVAEEDLDATLREPSPGLGAEERSGRIESLALSPLASPEPPELRLETVGEEDVASAATLGDLRAKPDPDPRLTSWQVDVTDVEADDLREPEAGAQSEGDEQSLPWPVAGRLVQRQLVGAGQGGRS
jgi:hypothetical protein